MAFSFGDDIYDKKKNELQHHGIKGQKWGVRRYQNPDGTLTPEGKKRYASMTPKELEKHFVKQIRSERRKLNGWLSQWSSISIGDFSAEALKKRKKLLADVNESETAKRLNKAITKLEREYETQVETGKKSFEDWEKEYDKVNGEHIKLVTAYDGRRTLRNREIGFEFAKEFSEGIGREISVGYLRDLGYDKSGAEYVADLLTKSNKGLY